MPDVSESKRSSDRRETRSDLKNLKVLVLATTFPRWAGDSEPPFVFDLTRQLAKNVSLWVLAPHAPGANREEEIEGVRILRFPYFFPKRLQMLCYEGGILPKLKSRWSARLQLPFFLAAQFLAICRTIKKHEINFIHCHWIIPQGFFVALHNSFSKIPFLLTAHGGDVYSFRKNHLIRMCSNFALKKAYYCTVNSQPTGQAVQALRSGSPVQLIPMGVDTQRFHPENFDQKIKDDCNIQDTFLLAVGRFAEKKGFRYLISAMPEILKKKPETKLVIIGFGPQKEELQGLIAELNLQSSVVFPGSKSGKELAQYFATADIFIGPSVVTESGDTEGQGVVFLEAMASKTAVIASDVGGIKDIVRHGETGLLIPQKDPGAIAENTLLLLNDQKLRNHLAENGRTLAESEYSWETTAERFLETYGRIFDKSH
ncbi:MAG: glycosyl transferase family 1 [Nitrospinaceae bacterium]|nr:MAG: glycosyl transferase family 1 [Nitrospinaceae bacterium]